ncbi:hypothetical protein RLW55_03210 [Hyphomicrobium sp. B1]|uniref:hypothetical protein n=1 Tax=Hyphomicrobium sp. B1 TaxID=3075651 RepID=UPI003C2C2D85
MEKLDYGATAKLRAVLRTLLDQLGRECAASTEIAAIIADEKAGRRRSIEDRRRVLKWLEEAPERIEASAKIVEMLKELEGLEVAECAVSANKALN